jgi:23S rRNA pseudouridine1911/1915/1917 synthase
MRTFRIEREDAGVRLDLALVRLLSTLPGITRQRAQSWIEEGLVRVNGQAGAKPTRRLALGDEVEVALPPSPSRPELVPEEMLLAVVYEDDWLLALDKPPGLLVYPAGSSREATLMHALLWRAQSWGEGRQPHLVSRLDRGTSGLLLVGKTSAVHARLQAGKIEKDYLAVVYGRPEAAKGRIDLGIQRSADGRRMTAAIVAGRPSTTLWEKLSESERAPLSLLRCRLLTGRTHQIRVHLQAVGLPIVGDPVYGEPGWKGITDPVLFELCRTFPRPALHAWRLAFAHPVTRAPLELTAPVPPDLAGLAAAAELTLP